MPTPHKNIRDARIQIYFDCICGTLCSVSALIGFFFFAKEKEIIYPLYFTLGLVFWIGYLAVSLFVIGLGIYTYYREKNFDPDAIPKNKLKAPIV